MTKGEAVRRVKGYLTDCLPADDYEEVEEIIKTLEQEPRWIFVSERLPEEVGLYLVSVKNEHDRRYSKTCWFNGKNNWFARQDVVAWMPLPHPPYREEEDDKQRKDIK